ncbi:MAG: galactose mutarotase [Deltaproteobacteria bacterium]|nr:galactose mutarotase [Deltaproteobacteria bacterium]
MVILAAVGLASCGGSTASGSAQTTPDAAAPDAQQAGTVVAEATGLAPITSAPFGTVDGKEVSLYTMTNANGLILKVTNYGTIVTEFHVPDRDGKLADIVGGYDNVEGYVEKTPYFGATIGRLANRITDNGRFTIDGKEYQLATNDAPYHLHGGKKGWDKVVWEVVDTEETTEVPSIRFKYLSPDGEEGYPGNVTAFVTYTLTNDNEFKVHMEATTDQSTIINMAHHSYWNLAGYDSGTIKDQVLTIYGDQYTPGNPVVADGTVSPVKGTPFDFTTPKAIGKDLMAVSIEGNPAGFDHNWVINGDPHTLRPVARVEDPKSGRVMELEGDQPGLMFYAGLFLDGTITGKGHTYQQYEAFCLETQKFPNSINVPAWRDEVILKPGQTYTHNMIHRFSAK